jgi:hypothetical protein
MADEETNIGNVEGDVAGGTEPRSTPETQDPDEGAPAPDAGEDGEDAAPEEQE